ncbi:hypothetical protein F5Y03DRAFT_390313 [Xylaria venustula]|nr:hypothetical protein F5Y03DRAFT_390313 [Xylaria venustula]
MNQGQAQATSELPVSSLWDGAEADEQIFPAFGAWKKAKQQLNKFLEDAISKPGVMALSLASQPATGKSTSLIKHIAERAYISRAPRLVLYILSTEVEARFIKSWLIRHNVATTTGTLGPRVQVEVMTVERFIAGVSVEGNWSRDLTIIFDINWYPTVDDEIALTFILHRAAAVKTSVEKMRNHLAIVLLMSGYESSRTLRAFRERVGDITQINLLQYHHQYPLFEPLGRNWQDTVAQLANHILAHDGRVVLEEYSQIGEARIDIRIDQQFIDIPKPDEQFINMDIATLRESKVLRVTGKLPYAVGIENVNLVRKKNDDL